MKRFGPVVLIAVAAAAVIAMLRTTDQPEPAETWKPVPPS